MTGKPTLEELLPSVHKAVDEALRRHRRSSDFGDDFRGWVLLKIVAREGKILGQFRGDCAFPTYLRVVVTRLYCDYVISQRGKWRPSKKARQLGPGIAEMEKLVYYDGYTVNEAISILDTCNRGRRADLLDAFRQIPCRNARTIVDLESQPNLTSGERWAADAFVRQREADEVSGKICGALAEAISNLPLEDRQILALRFGEGLHLAEVSRRVGAKQGSLYSRLRRLLKDLRTHLESSGFCSRDLNDILKGDDAALSLTSISPLTVTNTAMIKRAEAPAAISTSDRIERLQARNGRGHQTCGTTATHHDERASSTPASR